MSEQSIETKIQAKGLTAPRLSPADLDANIADTEIVRHVTRSGQVLRWAILTAQNGFAMVGKPSVSVSPENDNAEIGEEVAIDNARIEMWPLMGYALKQQLHERANAEPRAAAAATDLPPHQQRVIDEKRDLDEKLAKLEAFFDTPTFAGLEPAEQQRLHDQAVAMHEYAHILADRVEAFVPVAVSDAT